MKITRQFQPTDINWHLLPDLVIKTVKGIPRNELREGQGLLPLTGDKLEPLPQFAATTYSQSVTLDSSDAFLEFVRSSSETLEKVDISLECQRTPGSFAPYTIVPPFFRLSWRPKLIVLSFWRTTAAEALQMLQAFEDALGLKPARPDPPEPEPDNEVRLPALKRTVFIAHSFDDAGRSYAFQLTKFLSLLGFQIATGEGFAPESISAKVKRRLAAQEVVVVVMSEKQDLTWLVHETAGAAATAKPVILLIEKGIDFKLGILGDLEYIVFEPRQIAETFTPILEGLRELGFSLR